MHTKIYIPFFLLYITFFYSTIQALDSMANRPYRIVMINAYGDPLNCTMRPDQRAVWVRRKEGGAWGFLTATQKEIESLYSESTHEVQDATEMVKDKIIYYEHPEPQLTE
jgi:hypothetical protein